MGDMRGRNSLFLILILLLALLFGPKVVLTRGRNLAEAEGAYSLRTAIAQDRLLDALAPKPAAPR